MRVGLIPETIAERVLLRAGKIPVPLIEPFGAMMLARAVMAGVRLGIFAALGNGAQTVAELAKKISCNEAGVRALCDALVGCGYVAKRGERYAVTPMVKRWLLPNSPQSVADFLDFNYDQWLLWSNLEDIVRTGATLDFHHRVEDPEIWQRYMRGMKVLEKLNAAALVKNIPVPPQATALLDIGGGPGFHSVALCRKYPRLRAVVMDLERAAAVGRELVREAGLADRITYRVGDVRHDDLGGGYDVVLLFNLIHHFDAGTNRRLCRRVWEALSPDGIFVIGDYLKISAPSPREQYALLIGLQFFLSSGADTYPLKTVQQWMREAGFSSLRMVPLAAGHQMIMGRKMPYSRSFRRVRR